MIRRSPIRISDQTANFNGQIQDRITLKFFLALQEGTIRYAFLKYNENMSPRQSQSKAKNING